VFSDFEGTENRVFRTVQNTADRYLMLTCMWLSLILQRCYAGREYLLAAMFETHRSPIRTA